MGTKKTGCLLKLKKITLFGLLLLGILFSGIVIANLKLPDSSPVIDQLTETEQIRMAEVNHLRQEIGNRVWPGWGDHDIPIVVYNEGYAFLIGTKDPAPGWIRVPYKTTEGGEWELVHGSYPYHRNPLPETGVNPQAFIVEIGSYFAASMTTKDWTHIHLVQLVRNELPNFLKPVVPYHLLINKFDSDWHISGILHESFHAFQAYQAYERLKKSENLTANHSEYPWKNALFREAWLKERHLLAKAMTKENPEKIKPIVQEWLMVRNQRRTQLTPVLIEYEKQREWLEGLAKYAELNIWKMASDQSIYTPLPEMSGDPDFNFYENADDHRKQEIRQLRSDLSFSESMFYYSGWAQAEILDKLYPNWKSLAFEADMNLDELLEKKCDTSSNSLL